MNIIEAIKSGKRFRRKGWEIWSAGEESIVGYTHGLIVGPKTMVQTTGIFLQKEDILADDWQIEEKVVEITESQLSDAIMQLYKHTPWFSQFMERPTLGGYHQGTGARMIKFDALFFVIDRAGDDLLKEKPKASDGGYIRALVDYDPILSVLTEACNEHLKSRGLEARLWFHREGLEISISHAKMRLE